MKIKSNNNRLINKRKKISIPLLMLSLPMIIQVIAFNYLPMFGVIVAFKKYTYTRGILGSPWVGLDNFKYFFESNDAFKVISNTIGYSAWLQVISMVSAVFFALLLYEVTGKKALKLYQTSILLPSFVSWVLVAYIGFALMSNEFGLLNHILTALGLGTVNWYSEPAYWPAILTLFQIWKGVGAGCIVYYAALMGIDSSLFEAAEIDGASRFKQIMCISLPSLVGIICIMSIMAIGHIMSGDFGLFYQVPRQSAALYPVTDIINTYIYRGLQNGNISQTSAVGLFQSVVGMILLLTTNSIIKKVSAENSMF